MSQCTILSLIPTKVFVYTNLVSCIQSQNKFITSLLHHESSWYACVRYVVYLCVCRIYSNWWAVHGKRRPWGGTPSWTTRWREVIRTPLTSRDISSRLEREERREGEREGKREERREGCEPTLCPNDQIYSIPKGTWRAKFFVNESEPNWVNDSPATTSTWLCSPTSELYVATYKV